jgi:hypothetical protein
LLFFVKSFKEQLAQISCSPSRAGQTTLNTTTPSGPSYDGGANFHCCARQGCKKLAGIKLLIDCAYEDNTLSITRTNCVIKAVKYEKTIQITKTMADVMFVFCCPCLKSPVVKPLIKSASRRLWPSSW